MLSEFIVGENVSGRLGSAKLSESVNPTIDRKIGLRVSKFDTNISRLNNNCHDQKSTMTCKHDNKVPFLPDVPVEQFCPPTGADCFDDVFQFTGRLDELLNGVTAVTIQFAEQKKSNALLSASENVSGRLGSAKLSESVNPTIDRKIGLRVSKFDTNISRLNNNCHDQKSTMTCKHDNKVPFLPDVPVEQFCPPTGADCFDDVFQFTGRLDELLNGVTAVTIQFAEQKKSNALLSASCSDDEDNVPDFQMPDELLDQLYSRIY
ncbi:hypothetical protein AHF37_02798 [Paragonimus kellicotti]|nr:hypothetical protein AHF37_02798 [Paragonimus kellicotti]